MALTLKDRVQETATANTTVSFSLAGASTGYQTFSSAIGNTNTTYYGATDGTNWEVGLGTYATSGNLLTRTTILSSSNSGSAVTFSGTVTVFVDYPSSKSAYLDSTGSLGLLNYAETVYAVSGTTPALSPTNGTIQTWTLSGSSTPTAGTWAAGQSMTLQVVASTNSITWSSIPVTWVGGSAPTLSTSLTTIIELWKVGSTIYGALVGSA